MNNPLFPHSGNADGFVAKLDGSGNILWNTFIDFGASESCSTITLGPTGDIFVGGTSEKWLIVDRQQRTIGDVFLARLSPDGSLLWREVYGSGDIFVTSLSIQED